MIWLYFLPLAGSLFVIPAESTAAAFPEVGLCPRAQSDLDYAIYQVMQGAEFQAEPEEGMNVWRRGRSGNTTRELLSGDHWIRLKFKRFLLTGQTRLIAEAYVVKRRNIIGVLEERPAEVSTLRAVQDLLDGIAKEFPCHDGGG